MNNFWSNIGYWTELHRSYSESYFHNMGYFYESWETINSNDRIYDKIFVPNNFMPWNIFLIKPIRWYM